MCRAFVDQTVGIDPVPGQTTEVWQMVALPGNVTEEYVEKHTDVIEKAKEVETSRAAVELCQQEIEAAQLDVEQMRQDTQQAAQNASDANTEAQQMAKNAEASRTAAQTSEQNAAASRNLANTHKEAAETAKNAAETAAQEAEQSKTAAETAAQQAAQSKTDIDNIKSDIEEAAKGENVTQIQQNMNDIGSLKESTAALQKRQNVLVGSETGNLVSCDDAFAAPLCGLNVYGNSTQDGTPSPNNPVPIVSAGDGGIVAVRVTGKNLIQPYTKNTRISKNGATMDYDVATQLVHIYGTTTGLADLYIETQQIPFHVKSAVTMSLTEVSGNIPASVTVQYSDFTTLGLSCTASKPYDTGAFDHSDAPGFLRFVVNIPEGLTIDCLFKVQLELGVTATTYETYHEQTLTLSTPNGLPGIPVTSGGNYTDQNGQQWVCDEVDLERGVKVQRVDKTAFDSTKTLTEQNAILTTPIETPLTSAEIAAYKALTAYGPDTVVQAGDGAGVRLDYQRDVNIAIKRIEDAVASMT